MPSVSNFQTALEGTLVTQISAAATTATVKVKKINGATPTWLTTAHRITIIQKSRTVTKVEVVDVAAGTTQSGTTVTLGTMTRGLPLDGTGFTGSGTPQVFTSGAKVIVTWDAQAGRQTAFRDIANTFSAKQTFSVPNGFPIYATTGDLPAGSAGEGSVYVTAEGAFYDYVAGSWTPRGTSTTANASTTVAGKVEIATAAQRAASTATGETGALLVPSNDALVKTSSGAGDENKIPVLGASGTIAPGFLGTGSPSSTNYLLGSGAFGTVTIPANLLFGDGSDGTPTWTSGASLNPATEKRYTTATLPVSQTLTVSTVNVPLVIHNTGDVTINGTVDLNAMGGAGGLGGQTNGSNGLDGTAGASVVSGWTAGAGAGGPVGGGAGGGGGGASSLAAGTAGGSSGGAAGTIMSANQLAILSSLMRGVVCGAGGGGGYSLSTGRGGAGKEGGGALLWMIGGNLTLGASSVIRANGVTGQAGISGTGGGGGGGGGGTILIIVAGTITNGGVTASASAGSGGAGIGGGGNGGAGAAGKVIIYSLSTGTLISA